MSLSQVSKDSTSLPVSLSDMKDHLRVDGSQDDAYITTLMHAGREYIEEETGRDINQTTWDETLPSFVYPATMKALPTRGCYSLPIELERPPLMSVTSVTYYDPDGTQQTWDSSNYTVETFTKLPGRITPKPSKVWPSTQIRPDAVTIRYVSGFATTPEIFKHALKLLVGLWFEERSAESELRLTPLTQGLERIINQLKVPDYR